MNAENDHDDLDDLLKDALGEVDDEKQEPAPVKKTAAKKTAKKAESVPDPEPEEVSEVSGVAAKIEHDPASEISMADIRAQVRAEIEAEVRAEALKNQAHTVVNVSTNNPDDNRANSELGKLYRDGRGFATGGQIQNRGPLPAVVHFVDDGFTVGAYVFYRGQEYVPKEDDHWARLTPTQQRVRYGRMMFSHGPWTGDTFDLEDPALSEEDKEKLRAVMEQQAQR